MVATTLTTMVGFIPLILGGGGFWPPLAVTIAGGVGGATLLGLYLGPAAYRLLLGEKTCLDVSQEAAPERPWRPRRELADENYTPVAS